MRMVMLSGNAFVAGITEKGPRGQNAILSPNMFMVDIGIPNSFAFRLVEEFTPKIMAMASVAYLKNPEQHDPTVLNHVRYSASLYTQSNLSNTWKLYNSLILGHITHYDNANLTSIGEEFLFKRERPRIWGRFELVQRTPAQLQIPTSQGPNQPYWVGALTLGYTHAITKFHGSELGLGGSVIHIFISDEPDQSSDRQTRNCVIQAHLLGISSR